jgi:hypothetical protein
VATSGSECPGQGAGDGTAGGSEGSDGSEDPDVVAGSAGAERLTPTSLACYSSGLTWGVAWARAQR